MTTHHRGLIPFVGLLGLALVFIAGSLVLAEREIDRLEARIAHLESQLPPPPEPWGGCVPTYGPTKAREAGIYLEYLTPDLTTVKTTLRRGETR